MKATKFTLEAEQGADGLWRGELTSNDDQLIRASITTPNPAILLGECARMLRLDLGEADRDNRAAAQSALKRSTLRHQRKAVWEQHGSAYQAELEVEGQDGTPRRTMVLRVEDKRTRIVFSAGWSDEDGNLLTGHGVHAEGAMVRVEQMAWDYAMANGWRMRDKGFDWTVKA